MFLPVEYFWLEPVILAAVVVFVVDLIGNIVTFNNRFVNALETAVLFTVIFGALVFFGYGNVQISVQQTPSTTTPANR